MSRRARPPGGCMYLHLNSAACKQSTFFAVSVARCHVPHIQAARTHYKNKAKFYIPCTYWGLYLSFSFPYRFCSYPAVLTSPVLCLEMKLTIQIDPRLTRSTKTICTLANKPADQLMQLSLFQYDFLSQPEANAEDAWKNIHRLGGEVKLTDWSLLHTCCSRKDTFVAEPPS